MSYESIQLHKNTPIDQISRSLRSIFPSFKFYFSTEEFGKDKSALDIDDYSEGHINFPYTLFFGNTFPDDHTAEREIFIARHLAKDLKTYTIPLNDLPGGESDLVFTPTAALVIPVTKLTDLDNSDDFPGILTNLPEYSGVFPLIDELGNITN